MQLCLKSCILIVSLALLIKFGESQTISNNRCKDVSLECVSRKQFCNNKAYYGLLFRICRSTCDWCNVDLSEVIGNHGRWVRAAPDDITTTSNSSTSQGNDFVGECVDSSRNCGARAALCQVTNYQTMMIAKCPKTCGAC